MARSLRERNALHIGRDNGVRLNFEAWLTFEAWTTWDNTVDWVDVEVGDFNCDRRPDIVGRVAQTGEVFVTAPRPAFANDDRVLRAEMSLWGNWSEELSGQSTIASAAVVRQGRRSG